MKYLSIFAGATFAAAAAFGQPATALASSPQGACTGLSATEQAAAQDALEGAQLQRTLKERNFRGRVPMIQTTGVELYVAAKPGVSQQWLQRSAQCASSDAQSPFAVEGASVEVRAAGAGYLVRITSDKLSQAQEVVSRAQTTFAAR